MAGFFRLARGAAARRYLEVSAKSRKIKPIIGFVHADFRLPKYAARSFEAPLGLLAGLHAYRFEIWRAAGGR